MNKEEALAIRTATLQKGYWEREFNGQTESEIREFASSIDDQNPIHHDEEFARSVRKFTGIAATGVRIMGFVSSAVGKALPGGAIYKINEVLFPSPLYAGIPINVKCTITQHRHPLVKVRVVVVIGTGNIGECTCMIALPE